MRKMVGIIAIFLLFLFRGVSIMAEVAQGQMRKKSKIYVAGHSGLVGSAIVRKLKSDKFEHIITRQVSQLDLRNQQAVNAFFSRQRPEFVFLAAAKVGGILANSEHKAEFIYDNIMINTNVIHAAYTYGVKKLLFLGSSCIYPRDCPQPIKEEYLLTSQLEHSNDSYAIAKIAGIKMCQSYNEQYGTNFICCMPTNLYGPRDNFNIETSHVLPALLMKFYQAKSKGEDSVVVWGTGKPRREFLYVDDLAEALFFLMQCYDGNGIINIGTGKDITILELAELIKREVGFEGNILLNAHRPDGTPRKLLNIDKLHSLGWKSSTSLEGGIQKTLAWCLEHQVF